MDGVCTKCGAPLASTSEFCNSCGAPVAKNSGGALKVILIVVAIMVGIGILGAGALGFTAWRVSKSIAANSKTNDALFSIPGLGTIATGNDATADPSQLGAPLYPGAVQEKGAVSIGISKAAGAEAHFTTGDPISQVVDFYTSNMPGAIIASTAKGAVIDAGPSAKDRATVTISPGSGTNKGKTTIVIVRAAKN
jgi:zinc-ribbon domain